MRLNPFHMGFWLASNLYDFYEPAESTPNWKRIAWNTRKLATTELRSWCSEEDSKAVPSVKTWLRRVDIYPWLGSMYSVWVTEVEVNLYGVGGPESFARRMSFGSYDEAVDDFRAHGHILRWGLAVPRARSETRPKAVGLRPSQ